MRFDEMELDGLPPIVEGTTDDSIDDSTDDAPRFRRILALLTDLSLFAALTLALLPLLPPSGEVLATASLAGFVIIVSYYYFVGSWLLWGKTIGGAIFDVRVISDAMTPK